MGCTLATATDDGELNDMVAEALTYMQPAGEELVFNMYIGLIRKTFDELDALPGGTSAPENDPTEGDPIGPWMWIDGCTNYEFNPFRGGMEPNNAPDSDERVGAIRLVVGGLQQGDVLDIDVGGTFPALYECCHDD